MGTNTHRTTEKEVERASHLILWPNGRWLWIKRQIPLTRRHSMNYFFRGNWKASSSFIIQRIINNACLDLPALASTTNLYYRRRPFERIVPLFRTELYRNSFLPFTALLWNNLPGYIQGNYLLNELKRYLTTDDGNVPGYYLGKGTEPIFHRRLHLEMSDFNFDLFSRHACGHPFENAEHFLLFCSNYHNERINTITHLQDNYLDIHIFDQSLGPLVNEAIFKNVREYIRKTRHFSVSAIVTFWRNIYDVSIKDLYVLCDTKVVLSTLPCTPH